MDWKYDKYITNRLRLLELREMQNKGKIKNTLGAELQCSNVVTEWNSNLQYFFGFWKRKMGNFKTQKLQLRQKIFCKVMPSLYNMQVQPINVFLIFVFVEFLRAISAVEM